MYSVQFTRAATRIFKKLPPYVRQKIKHELVHLANNPNLGESLKGKFRNFRSFHLSYKGTAYRIIYQVYPTLKSVIVYLADKRENIYKRLETMHI